MALRSSHTNREIQPRSDDKSRSFVTLISSLSIITLYRVSHYYKILSHNYYKVSLYNYLPFYVLLWWKWASILCPVEDTDEYKAVLRYFLFLTPSFYREERTCFILMMEKGL